MTMTDPVADMLTRIRNANTAMHDDVNMPSSRLKESLADLLQKEGYIQNYIVSDNEDLPGKTLTIEEQQSLLASLFACKEKLVSPFNRQILVNFDAIEIEPPLTV